MRDLLTKKMNAWDILAGNSLRKHFQWLERNWMTSRSTRRLAVSEYDYAGNLSEVSTEGSRPTPGPLNNVVSILVNILVGI